LVCIVLFVLLFFLTDARKRDRRLATIGVLDVRRHQMERDRDGLVWIPSALL
jgi:hypothetical protein